MRKKSIIVRPYDAIEDNQFAKRVKLKYGYVMDGIGDEYRFWVSHIPVFISAQTGCGKNTFIEKGIIPYANEQGKRILLISNRVANNLQMKRRIAKLLDCDIYNDAGLMKAEEFRSVWVLTYQRLANLFENCDNVIAFCRNFDFVIMDECHFFCSDSKFNGKTGYMLSKIPGLFAHSIRVYMTSTPDEVLPEIIDVESRLNSLSFYVNSNSNPYYPYIYPRKIMIYDFMRNYKYLIPKYFDSIEEIVNEIENDITDSKWLIFVDSKDLGSKISEKLGKKAVFIDADSKDSKGPEGETYRELVNSEQFSQKVLIATSVVDNGINIKDEKLKNLVILTYEETEFLQMVGRKRIKQDEKVNLYICGRKPHNFIRKIYQINNKIQAICMYKKDKKQCLKNYFGGSTENFEVARGLFYFDKQQSLQINCLAERKLYRDKKLYIKIKEAMENGKREAFILEQLSWIGMGKKYSEENWINSGFFSNCKDEFISFVKKNVGVTIVRENTESFYKKFKELYVRAYGKRKNDRPDRNYGVTVIRSIFKDKNLPYELCVNNYDLIIVPKNHQK